jgi:hypothetical protein
MTELPVQRLLLDAVQVLDELKIPYAVMGGFAVRAWGIPRPTYDVDLAVAVGDHDLQRLLAALQKAGFDVPEEFRGGFRDIVGAMRKVKVTRFAAGAVWDVDLFMAQGPFFDAALPRRRARPFAGREVQTLAPEDVIALKLLAFRRKDQLDVEEILKVTTDLDTDHLRRQLRILGVEDRLGPFLEERS